MCGLFAQVYESLQETDGGFIRLNNETDRMIKEAVRSCSGRLDDDGLDALGNRLVDETERTQYEAYAAGFRHAFKIAAWMLMAG